MKSLLDRARIVYDYIKKKNNVPTYMQVAPQQALVELHLTGLGFELVDKTKKTCKVLLKVLQNNWQMKLALAHYSLSLSSIFWIEYSCSQIIMHHFKHLQSDKPLRAEELYTTSLHFSSIFKNEHVFSERVEFTFELMKQRLRFFAERKVFNFNETSGEITLGSTEESQSKPSMLLGFFQ